VALKVPNAGVLGDPKRVERFLREAKAAAQLRHPNIVPVFDAGRDGDQYFIASSFIDGSGDDDAVALAGYVLGAEGSISPTLGAKVGVEIGLILALVTAALQTIVLAMGLASRHDDNVDARTGPPPANVG
jgi:hypothetical protein